ncbi:unnamed protein product [Thelazia callipaeda]|uniref:Malonyl-CoA decarboxylase, mitochondrial n=1 Tax=Thelazia callipaeda TaxID=103827 RepID=A0A158RAS7_THECL|nr:unnamed protein product [Thelazia callipaeda]
MECGVEIAGEKFVEKYFTLSLPQRRSILTELSQNFGVNHEALKRAILVYKKNEQGFMNIGSAVRPRYFYLFQSVGNLIGGIKQICFVRADVLEMLRSSNLTRNESAALRPVESCLRDLLTLWFCQSNLRLQQLKVDSPIEILDKVMKYEAVHPIASLLDMKRRLGPNRRCFVFMHEAMSFEPLIVVYVAFMQNFAKSMEEIMNVTNIIANESLNNTAVFYSISSIQPGLRGIDLGNMIIKRVIAEILNTNPHIRTFGTLSPMPHFRSWLLRSLKCAAPSGDVIDERLMAICEENESFKGDINMPELVRLFLLNHLNQINLEKRPESMRLEEISEIIMHLALRYLVEIKHTGTGRVFDPVENFHLRNGAEIYSINWKADTTTKGMERSYGLMVNYRYRLDLVAKYADQYIKKGEIAVNSQALAML